VSRAPLSKDSSQFNSKDTQYKLRIAYRALSRIGLLVIFWVLFFLGITGCSNTPTPYRPPAISFHSTPSPLPSLTPISTSLPVATPLAISPPACTDNLTFLEDVSIPNGTAVAPGASIDKRWLVQNSGSCNWDDRYRLKFVSGAEITTLVEQALFPARSGTKASLRMLFTAPTVPGTYQSAWQAFDPQGKPFGDPISIQFVVNSIGP
jgi:hypothetical protein